MHGGMLLSILLVLALLAFRRPPPTDDRALIEAALDGDATARRALVERVAPIVRARVRRHVRGPRGPGGLDVDDLTHEVWCRLLSDDAARLRAYDPERGKTLDGFVSMVAGQLVATVAEHHRAQKRAAPGGEGPLEEAEAVAAPVATPEKQAEDRRALSALWTHLDAHLPERGRLVLRLLYLDHASPDEAAATLGVNRQVVYNWQHKIRGLAGEFAAEAKDAAAGGGRSQRERGEER